MPEQIDLLNKDICYRWFKMNNDSLIEIKKQLKKYNEEEIKRLEIMLANNNNENSQIDIENNNNKESKTEYINSVSDIHINTNHNDNNLNINNNNNINGIIKKRNNIDDVGVDNCNINNQNSINIKSKLNEIESKLSFSTKLQQNQSNINIIENKERLRLNESNVNTIKNKDEEAKSEISSSTIIKILSTDKKKIDDINKEINDKKNVINSSLVNDVDVNSNKNNSINKYINIDEALCILNEEDNTRIKKGQNKGKEKAIDNTEDEEESVIEKEIRFNNTLVSSIRKNRYYEVETSQKSMNKKHGESSSNTANSSNESVKIIKQKDIQNLFIRICNVTDKFRENYEFIKIMQYILKIFVESASSSSSSNQ